MKTSLLIPLCLSALLGVTPRASAQGGGFTAGDLYLCGHLGNQGGSSPPHGLVSVDPISGQSAIIKKFTAISGGSESMAFDPYRQRLILMARLNPADGGLWRPYLVDAGGQFEPLEPPVASWNGFSPTGDGRIYVHDGLTSVTPFKWLDAANQIHVLYDTDGVTPFVMDTFATWLEDMIYVASENALFTVTSAPFTLCPGGIGPRLHIRKIPLTADGTRVSGPMGCAEFDVAPADGETSHGFSLMTDGDLLLGAHTGLYGPPLPRLIRVKPSTLAISSFALYGDSSNGGTSWSTALGKAVTQAHFVAGMLAYSAGQVDDGVMVPSTILFQDTRYAIEEIPVVACDGGWIAYGLGLKGKGNLVPKLTGAGCPEPGKPITVTVSNAVGGASSALFVSLSKGSLPFYGGTFHLGSVVLSLNLPLGGAPGLAGAGSLALPAALPPIPALSGTSIFLQAAIADAAAVKGVSLTQGLEIEIG